MNFEEVSKADYMVITPSQYYSLERLWRAIKIRSDKRYKFEVSPNLELAQVLQRFDLERWIDISNNVKRN